MWYASKTLQLALAAAQVAPWLVQAAPSSSSYHGKRASVCNGDASLCSKLYSNVTFIGAHDSYAIGESSIAANQVVDITGQLNDGIRLLQAQAHKSSSSSGGGSGIDLCHTSCSLLNGGSLEKWLSSIKSWSDANPTEVVTLLIVNSDNLPPSTFATAYQSTGVAAKSYKPASGSSPTSRDSWPTLGSLIDAGTPIVSFLASGADVSSVPYLLPEFSSMWENKYNQVTVPFDCSVDRIADGSSPANLMYLQNHFKDNALFGSSNYTIPDKANANTTNSMNSIMQDANNCASSQASGGKYPNFVLLDFYNTPAQEPFKAAAAMNGIQYKAPANPSSSSSSSSSSGSSGSSGSSSGASNLRAGTLQLLASASLLLLPVYLQLA